MYVYQLSWTYWTAEDLVLLFGISWQNHWLSNKSNQCFFVMERAGTAYLSLFQVMKNKKYYDF